MPKNYIEAIDFENMDTDAMLAKIKSQIKKPNLFLCGATGVGKSSLVNDIFNYSLAEGARVGEGAPITRQVHRYENERLDIVLHDSEGYEIGGEKQDYYFNDVIGYIDYCNDLSKTGTNDTERIHEVWYCVSAGNKRFTDTDVKVIEKLIKKNLPVCVIITKVDEVDEDELYELKAAILKKFPSISIFTYASIPPTVPDAEEIRKALEEGGYIRRDELLHWAVENLDESLRCGLLASVKYALKDKRDYVSKKLLPFYSASAVAIVVGNAFVPVPFTDSAALMALQSGMALHILKIYNISNLGGAVNSVLGSSFISSLGRRIAGSLLKYIPVIGTAVTVAVNSTTAASLTASICLAVNELCYLYLETCVDKNGKARLPFAEFFTEDAFRAVFEKICKRDKKIITDAVSVADSGVNK